ncbi:MAG: HAMP domain-containing sensor histidine kinase [Bacteroidota bacterium]
MKKMLFTLALVWAGTLSLLCQPQQLQQALEKAQEEERISAQAEALLALADYHLQQEADSLALQYTLQGLELDLDAEPALLGQLLFQRGYLHRALGHDNELSFTYIDSAQQYLAQANLLEDNFEYWRVYGGQLIMQNRLDDALLALEKAEVIALADSEVNDKLINVYNNMIAALQLQAQLERALEVGRKAILYSKNSTHYEYRGDLYYNHGNTFFSMLDMERVVENYQQAVVFFQRAEQPYYEAYTNTALATAYAYMDQFEDARTSIAAAEAYYDTIHDDAAIVNLYRSQANTLLQLMAHEEALLYVNKALAYHEANEDMYAAHGLNLIKSDCLYELNRYQEAEAALLVELALAEEVGLKETELNCYNRLKRIRHTQGNYEEAFAYAEAELSLKDSVYSQDLWAKTAEERIRQDVDTEQQARENAELQAQLLRSQNLLYSVITIGLLALLLVGAWLFYRLRQTQKQLAQQNTELANLNRTKDQFFGIIAHDLRSPITALGGAGEQLAFYLKKGDNNKLKRLAARLDSTTQNLSKLLDNLLQWALVQLEQLPFHPQQMQLHEISTEVVHLYEPIAEAKDITLTNEISTELQLLADPNAIRTILRNLINNALKFTSARGEVRLTAKANGTATTITVKDNGRGMDDAQVQQLFGAQSLPTTGTAGEKGMGLGLVLCQELVKLHQGNIAVESVPDKGTSFMIQLPTNQA